MNDERTAPRECGFVPFPENRAYGHWRCELRRWHVGPHRFLNYTFPRVPRFWYVRDLWGTYQHDRLWRQLDPGYPSSGYRRSLYPATYNPRET